MKGRSDPLHALADREPSDPVRRGWQLIGEATLSQDRKVSYEAFKRVMHAAR